MEHPAITTGVVATPGRFKRDQGLTYCRRGKEGRGPLGKTSSKWCECGHKRHGANHDSGTHHKLGMQKRK